MCGIVGWYEGKGDTETVFQNMVRMVHYLDHRGPDNAQVKILSSKPVIVFGHSRLSIIDLSEKANQPMSDNETGNVIILNGEIYNFLDLRDELEKEGFVFQSKSDTEVVLKLYNKFGTKCFNLLRGIFALAIWDCKKNMLIVARDAMGVKPLHYYQNSTQFIFSSEVRSLLKSGAINKQIDHDAVISYLTYGSVQEPYTLIKGIKSFPPGSYGIIDGSGMLEIRRYYNPLNPGLDNADDSEKVNYTIKNKLLDAIEMQMISDVPIGVFLSGGIDSSAIVSLMRQISTKAIKTFNVSYRENHYDESNFADLVVKANQTEHYQLDLTNDTIYENLTQALNDYDQPSLDGLNTWFVSKLVRETNTKVAFSGLGGDEIFFGYNRFSNHYRNQKLQNTLRLLPGIPDSFLNRIELNDRWLKIFSRFGSEVPGYFFTRQLMSRTFRSRFVNSKINSEAKWFDTCFNKLITDSETLTDALNKISFFETRTYMLSTLLRDADQMSMAHGLEVRVPLIDQEVVSHMLTLPPEFKLSSSFQKPNLVFSAGSGLPTECVKRRKSGFEIPFRSFFPKVLSAELNNCFNNNGTGLFNSDELRMMWIYYENGIVPWSVIQAIFVLNYWIVKNNISCEP